MSQKPTKGVDLTFRRKFNAGDIQKAQQKQTQSSSANDGHKRALLQARPRELNLGAKVGSVQVVNPTANAPAQQQGGYYCSVCNVSSKSSAAFLDHINGRKHQHALGVNLKIQHATEEEVRIKLGLVEDKPHPSASADDDDDKDVAQPPAKRPRLSNAPADNPRISAEAEEAQAMKSLFGMSSFS
jgi:U4/U6.U5 tri-snRNP component SNU23